MSATRPTAMEGWGAIAPRPSPWQGQASLAGTPCKPLFVGIVAGHSVDSGEGGSYGDISQFGR